MKKYISVSFLIAVSAILIFSSVGEGETLVAVVDFPGNTVVCSVCTHTISFTTANTGLIEKVSIKFDPGFGLGAIALGAVAGLNTGTLGVAGNTVIYTIANPETVGAGIICTIPLGNITNASVCATTYTVVVATRTRFDTIIDGPTPSNTFALTGNSLKITTPAQVILSGETSSLIKVIACDIYGNTDILFNDTVALSGSSPSRQFSSDGSIWINGDISITLVNGTGQFLYRDTATGVVAISISRAGYTGYTQSFKLVKFLTNAIPYDTTLPVVISTGATTITVPAGTFGSTFAFVIDDTPSGDAITNANNSTASDPSLKLVSELNGTVREAGAFAVEPSGIVNYEKPLNPLSGKSVILTIPYPPAISGSLEDGLRICRLDENTQGWILLTGTQSVNKTAKNVCVNLTSFSFYRIISFGVAQSLNDVKVYPNPFEIARARDGTLKFINLPGQATIKIYNIAGELVRTIQKNDTVNRATWDGRNEYGEKVATGIYFYVISSPQATMRSTGKIAVISGE